MNAGASPAPDDDCSIIMATTQEPHDKAIELGSVSSVPQLVEPDEYPGRRPELCATTTTTTSRPHSRSDSKRSLGTQSSKDTKKEGVLAQFLQSQKSQELSPSPGGRAGVASGRPSWEKGSSATEQSYEEEKVAEYDLRDEIIDRIQPALSEALRGYENLSQASKELVLRQILAVLLTLGAELPPEEPASRSRSSSSSSKPSPSKSIASRGASETDTSSVRTTPSLHPPPRAYASEDESCCSSEGPTRGIKGSIYAPPPPNASKPSLVRAASSSAAAASKHNIKRRQQPPTAATATKTQSASLLQQMMMEDDRLSPLCSPPAAMESQNTCEPGIDLALVAAKSNLTTDTSIQSSAITSSERPLPGDAAASTRQSPVESSKAMAATTANLDSIHLSELGMTWSDVEDSILAESMAGKSKLDTPDQWEEMVGKVDAGAGTLEELNDAFLKECELGAVDSKDEAEAGDITADGKDSPVSSELSGVVSDSQDSSEQSENSRRSPYLSPPEIAIQARQRDSILLGFGNALKGFKNLTGVFKEDVVIGFCLLLISIRNQPPSNRPSAVRALDGEHGTAMSSPLDELDAIAQFWSQLGEASSKRSSRRKVAEGQAHTSPVPAELLVKGGRGGTKYSDEARDRYQLIIRRWREVYNGATDNGVKANITQSVIDEISQVGLVLIEPPPKGGETGHGQQKMVGKRLRGKIQHSLRTKKPSHRDSDRVRFEYRNARLIRLIRLMGWTEGTR